MFKDKTVVVGISGGIAAYKAAEIVRSLIKKEARVYCIMTRAACEFITPLTLRTLSNNPVYTEMFSEPHIWEVEHIALAKKADLFVIAPATANIIGKVSNGIADDFLSTAVMATKAPVLFAPSMNVNMYENAITQKNIAFLQEQGYHFIEPECGELACGESGRGRLAEVADIINKAEELLETDKPLKGKRVLVTAGPTQEALDPVRFLTNYSTGRMGFAIARQAKILGAAVTLISGPTELKTCRGVTRIDIKTALEMYDAVMKYYLEHDIIIKAAAVADYRPKLRFENKIKKQEDKLTLELEQNPDILAALGEKKGSRVLVGFAAETHDVYNNALAKARKKNLDFIAANDLTEEGAGFACETNVVSFIYPDGRKKELPPMTKDAVARELLLEIVKIIR